MLLTIEILKLALMIAEHLTGEGAGAMSGEGVYHLNSLEYLLHKSHSRNEGTEWTQAAPYK